MDKNKAYSSEDIDNSVSELIDVMSTTDLTANQYRDLCQAIKDSPYFYSDDFIDYDYIDVHNNVYDYLDGMNESQILSLLIEYGFEGVRMETLDDEYKTKLLTKLAKYFTSTTALEDFLGDEMVKKLNILP
tara:strand:+ start:5981 stop:6373 length:393 start_codon:yes stop_codon:yes gene_type:complete